LNELETKESIVWIDPVDGTSDFLKGDLECVCTLIGISYKNLAKAGVVARIYDKTETGYDFKPRIYFGINDV